MLKVLYLGAKKHRISKPGFSFVYNDIIPYEDIDLVCDMMDVDLKDYDIIIATPPCNYYSRANRWYKTSPVALSTRHLLPSIIEKCLKSGKPFLVENTWSHRCPIDYPCWIFFYGTHVFYTNIFLCMGLLPSYEYLGIQTKLHYGNRDNNINVHRVISLFLDTFYGGPI